MKNSFSVFFLFFFPIRDTSGEQIVFLFFKSSIVIVRGYSSEVRDWVVSASVKVSLLPSFLGQVSSKKGKGSIYLYSNTRFYYKKPSF